MKRWALLVIVILGTGVHGDHADPPNSLNIAHLGANEGEIVEGQSVLYKLLTVPYNTYFLSLLGNNDTKFDLYVYYANNTVAAISNGSLYPKTALISLVHEVLIEVRAVRGDGAYLLSINATEPEWVELGVVEGIATPDQLRTYMLNATPGEWYEFSANPGVELFVFDKAGYRINSGLRTATSHKFMSYSDLLYIAVRGSQEEQPYLLDLRAVSYNLPIPVYGRLSKDLYRGRPFVWELARADYYNETISIALAEGEAIFNYSTMTWEGASVTIRGGGLIMLPEVLFIAPVSVSFASGSVGDMIDALMPILRPENVTEGAGGVTFTGVGMEFQYNSSSGLLISARTLDYQIRRIDTYLSPDETVSVSLTTSKTRDNTVSATPLLKVVVPSRGIIVFAMAVTLKLYGRKRKL